MGFLFAVQHFRVSVLRFDDPRRRDHDDCLALVKVIFKNFNKNLRNFYEPSAFLTIDEQLLEYHRRVKIKQYIPSKPRKFGIKLFWLCCANFFYMLNGVIYIGVGTIEVRKPVTSKDLTMHLMRPFLNTGRNLTGDNWFSSLDLVEELRNNDTSYIGTIRFNNRAVQPISKSTAYRSRKDTKVFYDANGTVLVSFWDKGTKPVLLFDTLHVDVPVPGPNIKAITVLEYNKTKFGVDIADKRIRGFTCKRKCRRWPYAIFTNLLDVSCNNAAIIFSQCHPGVRIQEAHYGFIKNAAYQLVDQQIKRRAKLLTIKSSTKTALELMGYTIPNLHMAPDNNVLNQQIKLEKQQRCSSCSRESDRKTRFACSVCKKPVCNIHRSAKCLKCDNGTGVN